MKMPTNSIGPLRRLITIAAWGLLTCGWSAAAMDILVTGTSDEGPGSLRQAILDANSTLDTDAIKFNLSGEPPFVIQPLTPLPAITSPVIIDGRTQPGYSGAPLIVLDGNQIPGSYSYGRKGLAVASGPSVIRALVISRFGSWGISIEGGEGSVVEGCFVGTDYTGKEMAGNGDMWFGAGILIARSSNNRIGGLTSDARNVISGNWTGIYVAPEADRNRIQGNFIGTDVTGTAALPNGRIWPPASIYVQGCYNLIGGEEPGAGNLISGNYSPLYPEMGGHGILIEDQNWGQLDTVGNVIQGNLIGTDVTGTKPLPNLWGILFRGGAETVIGGTSEGARNVISGNACTAIGGFGIWDTAGASTRHTIEGNYIGTDITGMQLLSNGSDPDAGGGPWDAAGDAIAFSWAEDNEIRGNVIAGNTGAGILAASRNLIEGNLIGTDRTGATLLGSHGWAGLVLDGGNTVIGNVISGNGGPNGGSGIDVFGPGNVIQRNFIGTDITGTQPMPNHGWGIFLRTAEAGNNQIGGAGAGNVISANGGTGISVNCSGNVIQGNAIGTDITGTQPMGNGNGGIAFYPDAMGNIIGGIGEGEGNVIAFNINPGVWLAEGYATCKDNPIRGNSIFGNWMGIALCACPNDDLDLDEGPNRLQNWPEIETVLSGQSSTIIQGRLSSAPNTEFHLDFYSNTSVDQSGRYEGERYLGTTTVQTDGDGQCTFSVTLPVTIPAGSVVTGTATDPEGNTSEFSAPSEPLLDTEPPVISCPGDVYVGCGVEALVPVTFSVTATDAVDPAPTVTCSPSSGTGFPIGTTVVTCTATDASGNSVSCSFNVIRAALEFTGFLPPIGGADASGGNFLNPVRTFKAGSTIPVKFTASCDSAPVLTGIHTLQAIHFSDATTSDDPIDASPRDAATTGNQFRLVDSQWHFNLDTKTTGMERGIWQLRATLSDGSQHHIWIQLK